MVADDFSRFARRSFLVGASATALAAMSGCQSMPVLSLTEAIRRLLVLASTNALNRLMAPGGFWDNQLARLALPDVFGNRGGVAQAILGSAPVKMRLQKELNHVAERGARRAAPIVADAVRMVGISNAEALIKGGSTAATAFLRQTMGRGLIDVMVPELGDGLRLASDPIVGQAISSLTGIDLTGVARSLASEADDAIWAEMGREEAAIRANPQATGDPLLIAAFGP